MCLTMEKPPEYRPVLNPYAHQIEASCLLKKDPPAFALLMEMRTGKTKVSLDEWGEKVHRGVVDQLLVIAPAGVYTTWEGEVDKHVPEWLRKHTLVGRWDSSAGKAKQQAFKDFMASRGPRVLLVNLEALSTVQTAITACQMFLEQGRTILSVDESTGIKNHQAKRTRTVQKLGVLATFRRILSGLAAPRHPVDLFSQFEFLNWRILGFQSYYSFRARYAVLRDIKIGSRTIKTIVGAQNVEELAAKVAKYSYRVRLEDCYDMPPSNYSTRAVTLTAEQKRMYAEMKEHATTEIKNSQHVTATLVITQMLRLHQILCGHTYDEDGKLHEIPENRTKELIALLNEHSGKAIIWCSYDADIRKVSDALEREFGTNPAWRPGDPYTVVARFWGGNKNTRDDEEKRFKTDPSVLFQVATPDAGGRGRTWDMANLVVYYSSKNNLDHRMQSEDRPKGVGKTTPINYVDLIVPGSVDEKFLGAMRGKMNLSSIINGDNYKEWVV